MRARVQEGGEGRRKIASLRLDKKSQLVARSKIGVKSAVINDLKLSTLR